MIAPVSPSDTRVPATTPGAPKLKLYMISRIGLAPSTPTSFWSRPA
jgi:hypothetical protein